MKIDDMPFGSLATVPAADPYRQAAGYTHIIRRPDGLFWHLPDPPEADLDWGWEPEYGEDGMADEIIAAGLTAEECDAIAAGKTAEEIVSALPLTARRRALSMAIAANQLKVASLDAETSRLREALEALGVEE